jgi:hypothetical protein
MTPEQLFLRPDSFHRDCKVVHWYYFYGANCRDADCDAELLYVVGVFCIQYYYPLVLKDGHVKADDSVDPEFFLLCLDFVLNLEEDLLAIFVVQRA